MKSVWTLTVKTSLPDVCESDDDLKVTRKSFETFQSAKCALYEILDELAFTDNAMFDGKGFLKNLFLYIEEVEEYERTYAHLDEDGDDADSDWLTSSFLKDFHNCLHQIFCKNNTTLSFAHPQYSDLDICVDIANNAVNMRGCGQGPGNGVDPRIKTNMFDMTEEKDYMLYINDLFGGRCGQELSAELYVDLNKVEYAE